VWLKTALVDGQNNDTSAAKLIGKADKNETRVDVLGSVKDG